jgi:osmotically-inducible protein OsmY
MGVERPCGDVAIGRTLGSMTTVTHQTDHQIKTAITEELTWAPMIDADSIGVAVDDGAVTLSGQVHSYPQKTAAVRAVLRLHGVSAVADEITVKSTWGPRTDGEIAGEATSAFERSTVLPEGKVKAAVHDRVVTLTGAVPWHYQREEAKRLTSTLRGVEDVRNLITLDPPVHASAEQTKTKITSAIVRGAQRDAQHVHVAVIGGEVTLTGHVSSGLERREAEQSAWYAPGVTRVVNDLVITY